MATPHQKHTALEFELFHTFLEADWYEFRTVGTTSVTNQIPRSRRSQFVDSFQALTRAGCREDVLFPCVLVFLNSQISGVDFPWAKKFEPIRTGLKKIRDATQEVMQFPGFRKLESNSNEPSLAVFSRFISAHRALLKTAAEYEAELEIVLKGLPNRNVVGKYGKAVICTYVQSLMERVPAQLSNLLGCFTPAGEEMNLTRDIADFRNDYPLFCESLREFLDIEHTSATRKLPDLDWTQFSKSGTV